MVLPHRTVRWAGSEKRKFSILEAATVASLLVWSPTAFAHGISGSRYFDGTLGFDDPAVADEAILPLYNQLSFRHRAVISATIGSLGFALLLTPKLAFCRGWQLYLPKLAYWRISGADKADIGLKCEAYRDNRPEALISVSLAWGIGHTGARGVGADAPNTIQPGVFFGKAFGDLPDSLSWFGHSP